MERDNFKNGTKTLTNEVARIKKALEELKNKLTLTEKDLCKIATKKLRLSEEVARGEGAMAEELAMVMQYERDLKVR